MSVVWFWFSLSVHRKRNVVSRTQSEKGCRGMPTRKDITRTENPLHSLSRECLQMIHYLVSRKWTQTNCGLYRLESSSAVYAFTKLFPSKTLVRSMDRMCLGTMNHRFIWSQECSTRARDNLINCTTNLGDIGVVRVLFRTQYIGDASRLKDQEME